MCRAGFVNLDSVVVNTRAGTSLDAYDKLSFVSFADRCEHCRHKQVILEIGIA